jgi:MFS family permease
MTGFGPGLGPIISGFVSPAFGWRWSFWITLIFAGVSFALLVFLSETNQPVRSSTRALRRHSTSDTEAASLKSTIRPKRTWSEILIRVLLRPLYFLVTEPIVSACSAYLALCYSIYYMSFQAYPIIFVQLYGLSPGQCGLVQLTIAAGCALTLLFYWAYNEIWLHRQMKEPTSIKRPNKAEHYRLPLACLGGPLFVISLFWLGWSSRRDVPFVVPMLAGIPFGMGFMCSFISLLYVHPALLLLKQSMLTLSQELHDGLL